MAEKEYIEREAVLEIFRGRSSPWDGYQKAKELPAADVRPAVRGKWVRHTDTRFGEKLNDCIECNCCGIWFSTENMIRRSFCPNCGADMREES